MNLPSCSTGVSDTMFGGNGGGGTGPTTAPPPRTMFGNRRVPPASAHAAVISELAMIILFFLMVAFLDKKCVESGPSHEEGPCDVVGGPGRHRAGSRPDR